MRLMLVSKVSFPTKQQLCFICSENVLKYAKINFV